MKEKAYRPIIKEGDHLLHSKDNPSRVRGLTRDENNKNQDIIEWEEIDVDDLKKVETKIVYVSSPDTAEEPTVELTPEQEELARQLGELVALVGILAIQKYVIPWWRNKAWPWIKEKASNIRKPKNSKQGSEQGVVKILEKRGGSIQESQFAGVISQIDEVLEHSYYEMNEDELKSHIIQLVYHMLGLTNEIRIISNAQIRENGPSEEFCIERQRELEKLLSERVVIALDRLLSNERLNLDLNISRELFALTGGGVRLNGEYVPVQPYKIKEAMKAISDQRLVYSNEDLETHGSQDR